MNTITTSGGQRFDYPKYSEFAEAKEALRKCKIHYVSYYDRQGDSHVCAYLAYHDTLQVCGVTKQVPIDAGEYETCRIACEIVKEICWEDFLGWSI